MRGSAGSSSTSSHNKACDSSESPIAGSPNDPRDNRCNSSASPTDAGHEQADASWLSCERPIRPPIRQHERRAFFSPSLIAETPFKARPATASSGS
jgi:hypothetical protein